MKKINTQNNIGLYIGIGTSTGTFGVYFDGQLNGNYGSGQWSSSTDGSSGF